MFPTRRFPFQKAGIKNKGQTHEILPFAEQGKLGNFQKIKSVFIVFVIKVCIRYGALQMEKFKYFIHLLCLKTRLHLNI